MNCGVHMEVSAVATCCDCGSGVCASCRNKMFGRNYCDLCAAKLEDTLVAKPTPPALAPIPAPQVIIHQSAARTPVYTVDRKSPGVASVLSFFLAGAGQIYTGRVGRGLAVMLATYSLMPIFIGFFLWFWQLFDAAHCARQENERMGIES